MSEPKLISPMLDDFVMGDPISEHNGVRCCPAIHKESDNKYIVKIISTPASQSQLEALLLSGAYSSAEAANGYFKSLSDDIVEEAKLLEKLSQLEGFLPYADYQLIPMDEGIGYDIYLLSPYRKTLAQLLRQDSMTHLSALNLALDICAALTICRRSGYLYVNLKPENIYLETGKASKIGDIGFISLHSLRFTSLPDRYRSNYTAPEVEDAFASIHTTTDVYALGLILYQVFNDGLLPATDNTSKDPTLLPPAYADYEMAEIILKACHPDPEKRWQDPVEMGQAIVAYMQRNGAHDVPIVPVPVPESESAITDTASESAQIIAEDEESVANGQTTEPIDSDSLKTECTDTDPESELNSFEHPQATTTVDNCSENESNSVEISIETDELLDADTPNSDEIDSTKQDDENLIILETFDDETTPEQADEEIDYTEVSDEVSDMLQQADDLISHPALEPVVAPDPIDVPIPPPIQQESDEADSAESKTVEAQTDEACSEELQADASDTVPDSENIDEAPPLATTNGPIRKHHWLRNIFIILTVLAVSAVGILFYTKYYLQPIDAITLQEHENGDLTVLISSPVDESKLTVVCSDTYGNQLTQSVSNGKATFTGLTPDSAYTIEVVIEGFHRLTGDTSSAFTTPAQTNIVQFNAVTGSEDGSAVLTFTIDGPDSSQWQISYKSAASEENVVTFTGRMCTITGLAVGQEYEFVLTPETNLNYIGTNKIKHVASAIVKATDVQITSCLNDQLSTVWKVPENTAVDSWTVRCYSDSGYDKTIVTSETSVVFSEIDSAQAHTVEVTAAGMSVSERAYVAANSATVTDFSAEASKNEITLSWNSNGFTPANGWLLMYTVDGSPVQELTGIKGNSAIITAKVPDATYSFTLQTVDGTSVLGGQTQLEIPKAKSFSGYGVSAKNMEFKMCKTPSKKNWDRFDLSSSDYKTTFKSGEKASFLVRLKRTYNTSKDSITTLFVIRNEDGAVACTSSSTSAWTKMWYRNYCELNIPTLPKSAGKYTIEVYFNGALAHSQGFKVTA